jgi:hypothetical protein
MVINPPADPPRALTPLVRRRAWTEPRVRLWWVLCLGVLGVTLVVAARQAVTWWSERQLLSSGVTVEGTIVRARTPENDMTVPGRNMSPDSVCTIEFEWPKASGRRYKVTDVLRENVEEGRPVVTGSKITLHVDADDPDRWTARTKTPPLGGRQLIGVAVGAPVVGLLALVAALKRRRMLDVWVNGQAIPAQVLGTGTSPVAPQCRSLRCTSADLRDKRVFTVFVPSAGVAAGDELWAVRIPEKPEPTAAAAWFERPGDVQRGGGGGGGGGGTPQATESVTTSAS